MDYCCAKCSRMKRLIREIIAETPTPTPVPPEPRSITKLTGTQMQIEGYPLNSFEDREVVNFHNIICESPNISYSEGNFTLLKSGTYFINWQMATGATLELAHINFSIYLNGEPYATASMLQPELNHARYISGSVIVNASQGDTVALVNTTDDHVGYKQGNITILGLI